MVVDSNIINSIGYVAATLVLATFCMHSMRTLRWVAIASNVAFIAYALLAGLGPVPALHSLLLPSICCLLSCAARRHSRRKPQA